MTDPLNPYASPSVNEPLLAPGVAEETEAEAIRRRYLKHETSVRSIGILYYLGGGIAVVGVIGISLAALGTVRIRGDAPPLLLVSAIYAIMGGGFLAIGRGLRRLRHWVKWPVGILSAIGLLGFPLGTLINAYILYLVFCEKGNVVLSPEYQRIMQQTPHIRYRTSLIAWIVLAIFLAVLAAAIALPLLSTPSPRW